MSSPAASLQPYIAQAGEHQRLAYTGGHELAIILHAAINASQLTVIDAHARRRDASPVHVHSRDDEAFLLLDGAMTVWVGGRRIQFQPGGIAFLPRNIPHAVRYDIASRALVLSTPGGSQEGVFRRSGAISAESRCLQRPRIYECPGMPAGGPDKERTPSSSSVFARPRIRLGGLS